MMRGGEVCEHQRWALRTAAKGGSVSRGWPTMTASEGQRGHGYQRAQGRIYPTLTGATGAARAWPTPSAQTFDQSPAVFDARRERLKAKGINGNGAGRLLAVEVRRAWPTPSATDHKGSSQPGQRRGQLTEPLEPGSGGRLNPRWVEALQGFPLGWTALTDGPPLQDHSTPGSLPEPDHASPTTGND